MAQIVIVDDRSTNRHIFGRLAASIEAGTTVKTFGDPAAALAWLADHSPDLIITDYKMPGMDGAAFIRAFRTIETFGEIPIVVITVSEERAFRLQALEAGATDFLSSPVDHQEFLTRARNLLKMRKQQLIIANRADHLAKRLQVSERSHELALRDSRERLAQVIDTLPVHISAAGYDGRILFVNASQTAFAGLEPAAAIGRSGAVLLGPSAAARSHALDRMVFDTGKALPSFEEERTDASGARRIFHSTKAPLRNVANEVTGVLTTSLDITARKADEAHLRHLANHDALTELPNRVFLSDRIAELMSRGRRSDGVFAVHVVDLDAFKGINDLLGHTAGDAFLRDMGRRLRSRLPEADVVARLGGDEFAIVQSDLATPEDATRLAHAIVGLVAEHDDAHDDRLSTTASVGVALYPLDGMSCEELLKTADLAMYKAKADGGNTVRFYEADMKEKVREAAQLDADLKRALSDGQFTLLYQPQVDLATGRIVGAEALLRWRQPDGSLRAPASFLPRAEDNGLIVPINEWVIFEACREAKNWQRSGLPPLRVGVNVSSVQFRRRSMPLLIARVLAETGLDPRRLDLELTESHLLQDSEGVAADLRQLTELGVHLAIDDFGTGYASFGYVKRFPVDRIKIDRSFVQNMAHDANDAAIVRAIVMLGHSLGIAVVAEGVETADHLAKVRAEGCDEVQGFYFGRPMQSADFIAFVQGETALARRA